MSNRTLWLTLLSSILLSGCGLAIIAAKSSQALHAPMDSGESKPGPYIIGDIQFRPNIEQGQLAFVEAFKYSVKGVVSFEGTADLKPIDSDKNAKPSGLNTALSNVGTVFFGTGVDYSKTYFSMLKNGISVVPMPAGVIYIRSGNFMVRAFCQSSRVTSSDSRCVDYVHDQIKINRDIKIDIPADAGAVYIGRLVIDHNGALATNVTVSDQYSSAMDALRRNPIAGIDLKKVKKRLAIVLPKN